MYGYAYLIFVAIPAPTVKKLYVSMQFQGVTDVRDDIFEIRLSARMSYWNQYEYAYSIVGHIGIRCFRMVFVSGELSFSVGRCNA